MLHKTRWPGPAVALEHKGVTIYHTYRDDHADMSLLFRFTTSTKPNSEREPKADLDIRRLPGWKDEIANVEETLRHAIDQGWLTQDGLSLPTDEAADK